MQETQKIKKNPFRHHAYGSTIETVVYPVLILAVMWTVHWGVLLSAEKWYTLGILPGNWVGLRGILFSPFLHSDSDWAHILNNSFPIVILTGALVYFYYEVARNVFLMSWFFSGLFVWVVASPTGGYHIGMSSIIYALAAFLFVSGTLRKFKPLQGISLFVAFVYGSMIWGILPLQERVSWEGHLGGMLTGIVLAILYRKRGPQSPKFQFEIEQELGIEPPDLEGQWRENIRLAQELEAQRLAEQEAIKSTLTVIYDYKPKDESHAKKSSEGEPEKN